MRALYQKEVAVGVSLILIGLLCLGLAGCGGGSTDPDSTATDDSVGVAYVRRPNSLTANPTDSFSTETGGDLYIKEQSAAASSAKNITGDYTLGQGDVSDPEVSYDGTKIVFAMRCSMQSAPRCYNYDNSGVADTTWNIWEYNRTTKQLRRIIPTNAVSSQGDDVDPVYLPGNTGIVFSSNRQLKSSSPSRFGYKALDEYERERVINLHVMTLDGLTMEQISFNQSHDRNPSVLRDGKVMFARWDHVSERNHFAIFDTNPDGTGIFVKYGSHSPGNSFLHPREMQDGRIMSDLMPLSGTQEGGALMIIDTEHYTENDTPKNKSLPSSGGQRQATATTITLGEELSLNGRISTPYPLWDNTPRALVAFNPCQVRKDGRIIPCALLTQAERDRITQDGRLREDIAADPIQTDVSPVYSIQILNYDTQQMRTVVPAESGYVLTDPVALMARPEPNARPWQTLTGNTGTVEVLSVYDTDHLGRMGPGSGGSLLLTSELNSIPMTPPADLNDTRPSVANVATMKDPLNSTAYLNRPGRFVRITKPAPPPSGTRGLRDAIGETEFEMQQILGYTEVEPDGSILMNLPSDTPFGLTILDAKGRAIQTHTNWLQIRPGERLSCKGCHTPRPAFQPIADTARATHTTAQYNMTATGNETMALTRARLTANASMNLKPDITYTDVWANTAVAGVTATPSVSITYAGVPVTPVNGVINYPQHIQPIWEAARTCPGGGDCRCVTCHTDTTRLSLLGTTSATGRLLSYQELLVGDPQLDGNGQPVVRVIEGVPTVMRGAALINNSASQGDAGGVARKSRFTEIMSGDLLFASADSRTRFSVPPVSAPDHTQLLTRSEMRLVTEWMDLGGQYYNTPYDANGNLRNISSVSETVFGAPGGPHSILMTRCAGCHQPAGSDPTAPPSFQGNRFVLTGSAQGDFNATLALINDTCVPENSLLLSRPSVPHPATAQNPAVRLPTTDPDYTTIRQWILGGC